MNKFKKNYFKQIERAFKCHVLRSSLKKKEKIITMIYMIFDTVLNNSNLKRKL